MGIVRRPWTETDNVEQLAGARPPVNARFGAECIEAVGELCPDPPARVERRVRVLEDELETGELARARRASERRNFAFIEHNGATGRPDQANRCTGEARLAAAGLADKTDDTATPYGEARAGNRT